MCALSWSVTKIILICRSVKHQNEVNELAPCCESASDLFLNTCMVTMYEPL